LREVLGRGLVLRQGSPRFHRGGHQPIVDQIDLSNVMRLTEPRLSQDRLRPQGAHLRQSGFFNKIKQCRQVATRYDKPATISSRPNCLAFGQRASIRPWLRVGQCTL
jgi:hypothetical protein